MKRIGMHALALAILAFGCTEAPGGSASAESSRAAEAEDAKVLRALRGQDWDADAPGPTLRDARAEAALIRLARGRPGEPRVVRARATLALRHHPTEPVRRFLFTLARGDQNPEVVAAGLDTLARAFGRSHGAEVRELAESRLAGPDPGIRMAAREALARVRLARWISD